MKSKYLRLSDEEQKSIVKRAIALKRYDPNLRWKEVSERFGLNRAQLRELIKKHEPTYEGSRKDELKQNVMEQTRR